MKNRLPLTAATAVLAAAVWAVSAMACDDAKSKTTASTAKSTTCTAAMAAKCTAAQAAACNGAMSGAFCRIFQESAADFQGHGGLVNGSIQSGFHRLRIPGVALIKRPGDCRRAGQ